MAAPMAGEDKATARIFVRDTYGHLGSKAAYAFTQEEQELEWS